MIVSTITQTESSDRRRNRSAGERKERLNTSAGLARAVAAAFIGIELYEGADPRGAGSALDALDHLGAVLEAFGNLGPVAIRALRAKAGRTTAGR
ncbi:MAG TPA: hypothetical protein VE198_04585 [Actinoallomurus sp.]|jgi:hypothetical protein|nr:hypothetical protein [Actinoallomurus sp.]